MHTDVEDWCVSAALVNNFVHQPADGSARVVGDMPVGGAHITTYRIVDSAGHTIARINPMRAMHWQVGGGLLVYMAWVDNVSMVSQLAVIRLCDGATLYTHTGGYVPLQLTLSFTHRSLIGVCLSFSGDDGRVMHVSLSQCGELQWSEFRTTSDHHKRVFVIQSLAGALVAVVADRYKNGWAYFRVEGGRMQQIGRTTTDYTAPSFLAITPAGRYKAMPAGAPHPFVPHWYATVCKGWLYVHLGAGRVLRQRVKNDQGPCFDTCTWLSDGSGVTVHHFKDCSGMIQARRVTWTV